jgi:hypothetical protein
VRVRSRVVEIEPGVFQPQFKKGWFGFWEPYCRPSGMIEPTPYRCESLSEALEIINRPWIDDPRPRVVWKE